MGPFEPGVFGNVVRNADSDPAKQLDALGNFVHQFGLLFEMLVQQKVKLVERFARYLPVVLFVEIAKHDRIGEDLVEVLCTFEPDLLIKPDREADYRSELLDRLGALPEDRRGATAMAVSSCMCFSFWHYVQ